ncbi:Rossmann-fold NAD(P)-binding domain-containing protein [Pedobacter nutrimenti]|nr:lactate dehydrogenase [Pedobacter nutrimenti]
MSAVAYSVDPPMKEPLAIAYRKKHEITLIANSLGPGTVCYAEGKNAVIVFSEDVITADLLNLLAEAGVKYIASCSVNRSHIDQLAAAQCNIRLGNVPTASLIGFLESERPMTIALEMINNLDKWQADR